METGYVAFLDVLGFSDLVARDRDGTKLTDYVDSVRDAARAHGSGAKVQFVIFSDSVVLNTKGDGDFALGAIVRACSHVFGALLEKRIAVRGAIAHGQFTRSEEQDGTFVAGNAILEAYRYEQLQDWTGIMLCPSVLRRHLNITSEGVSNEAVRPYVRHCREIPLRSEPGATAANYSGFALIPAIMEIAPGNFRENIDRCTSALSTLMSWAPTPAAQDKHKRALSFLNWVLQWG